MNKLVQKKCSAFLQLNFQFPEMSIRQTGKGGNHHAGLMIIIIIVVTIMMNISVSIGIATMEARARRHIQAKYQCADVGNECRYCPGCDIDISGT